MTLRVPYIVDESIERDAEALLAQFAHARGVAIRAPIPIEDIIEKHLKLHVEFDDLHRRLEIPRGGLGTEPDIFGAIWLEAGEIIIDESLDPEVRPAIEGRYRFTLGHEGGHWRLHRPLVEANGCQESLFGDTQQPTVVCRSSQSKERVELQADLYASCVLMPRELVLQAWRDRFGNDHPRMLRRRDRTVVACDVDEEIAAVARSFDQARDNEVLEYFARPFAEPFIVSPIAMRIRLEKLGLLHREAPRQRSLLIRS
jgi:Zn-dependent peptidase ImmA (M78 family)